MERNITSAQSLVAGAARAIAPLFLIAVTAALGSTAHAQHAGADTPSTPKSFSAEQGTIFDIAAVTTADTHSVVTREVAAQVRVDETSDHGFWVSPVDGDARIFIVPAEGSLIAVRTGELVTVHGEIRLMRNATARDASRTRASGLIAPYVYAYTVRPARPMDTPRP